MGPMRSITCLLYTSRMHSGNRRLSIQAISGTDSAISSHTSVSYTHLSDLRESGSIEQDADIVIFLYRDEYYNKEDTEKPGECEVIVAKHRSGPTGSVDVAWIERYTQFKDKASGNIPDAGGMF